MPSPLGMARSSDARGSLAFLRSKPPEKEAAVTTISSAYNSSPTSFQEPDEHIGTVIIGAGQTGLSTAYFLRRAGAPCVVLDENARVGDQWRQRYDSLLLNTPAQYDGLPGLPFPAPRGSFPTGREMGDFLETYAKTMG